MGEIIGFFISSLLLYLLVFFLIILLLKAIALKTQPPIDKKESVKNGKYFWFKFRRYRRDRKDKRTLDEIIADEKIKKQNLEKQRQKSDYEKWLKDNPEYDPKNDPVAHDYLKDKRPKPLSTREKLEREFIKKRNNPDLNLFLDQDFELHLKRLRLYGRSKWNGETYFMGQRGGIYTISANGTRNYKY